MPLVPLLRNTEKMEHFTYADQEFQGIQKKRIFGIKEGRILGLMMYKAV